ncbi:MAG: glycosyl hydrolase, partial [Bacteroidota bacterium]
HLGNEYGQSWENITPVGLPESLINSIDLSKHNDQKAFIAVTRYKFNDLKPYIFKTVDKGKTWTTINNGIPTDNYVRVVREDPKREGLLYAGTERGLYVSFNDGLFWQKLQLNLPVTPINDICIQDNDLIIATAGRSFWILDDLSALQEYENSKKQIHLIQPKPTVKFGINSSNRAPKLAGQNPNGGLIFDYFLPSISDTLKLKLHILNASKDTMRSYYSFKQKDNPKAPLLTKHKGINRFNWNLRKGKLPNVKGVNIFLGNQNHTVPPGAYTLVLSNGIDTVTTIAQIIKDPRIIASQSDFDEQYKLLNEMEGTFKDIHNAVNQMRNIKEQLNGWESRLSEIKGAA